jgi:hypothetical protein
VDHFWIDYGFIAKQAGSMYRAEGPEELRSLGETEFVCGVAAMSASGNYGPTRCVAGLVGYVDLRLGSCVKGILDRHIGRLRWPRPRHPQRLDLERRSSPQRLRRGRDCAWIRASVKVFPPS